MIQRKQNKDGHFWHTMSRSNVIMVSESYVCCDVELQTDEEQEQTQSNTNKSSPSTTLAATEFFLKQVDCVMPCDPNFLYGFWANNKYGFLWPMGCDDPNGVFVEPKLLGKGL